MGLVIFHQDCDEYDNQDCAADNPRRYTVNERMQRILDIAIIGCRHLVFSLQCGLPRQQTPKSVCAQLQ